jgi:AbiTii
MPVSLVEQLQIDSVDRNVRTSDLLRKALLVASKLDIPGVPEWLNKELSGYNLSDEVPAYRKIHGRVMGRTFHGWRPVQFPTNELESKIAEQSVHQSVATLEEIHSAEGEPHVPAKLETMHLS